MYLDEDDGWDDGSDFDVDSDDSEEDESLCNTVLLTGPHGCGKTSSVYALALQQGFKVSHTVIAVVFCVNICSTECTGALTS